MKAPPDALAAALADRYRLERELGQGGMATVYLARDLKHDRDVAIKVLKPELAAVLGAERFVVEIRTTAALQHPHILPLFDSGEAHGFLYYVMPFIEGETLRAKLDREAQLGVDEAVRIASDVAGALHYAHTHGVIHRDIKPENILLHDGRPMVADFGIALAVSAAAGGRMTETGLSLGTPHYMSPEQATAEREITARSDVYSLATVLYEMLAGNPPHAGASAQQIIMKIITEPAAAVTRYRKAVPPNVAGAVARALEKLPADRFASAQEFARALGDTAFRFGAIDESAASGGTPVRSSRASRARQTIAAVALLLVGAAVGRWPGAGAPPPELGTAVRVTLPLPGDSVEDVYLGGRRSHAVSANGRMLAVIVRTAGGEAQIHTRALDALDWTPLAGTEGARNPIFSPDGAWIAFATGLEYAKIPSGGGPITRLARIGELGGMGSWGEDDRILLSIGSRLAIVPASGGVPRFLPSADSGVVQLGQLMPLLLPGGTHALFTRNDGNRWELGVIALETGKYELLGVEGYPLGIVDDVLVYGGRNTGRIHGVRFDGASRRLVGDPIELIATGLTRLRSTEDGVAAAVSASGTILYATATSHDELVLRDLGGRTRVLLAGTTATHPRFSPDGQRIAFMVDRDLWLMDRAEGAVAQRLTSDSASDRPEWTPDRRRLLFRSRSGSRGTLMERDVDGKGDARLRLALPDLEVWQGVLSPDERTIVYRTGTVDGADIWYQGTSGDTTRRPFAATAAMEHSPRFSPDGEWIAYTSSESGLRQVYVRAFPPGGTATRVSLDGGSEPIWSRDGRWLFYRDDQRLLRAAVSTAPAFTVRSREVILTDYDGQDGFAAYDVSPDGREIASQRTVSRDSRLVLVHGWQHELHARFARSPR